MSLAFDSTLMDLMNAPVVALTTATVLNSAEPKYALSTYSVGGLNPWSGEARLAVAGTASVAVTATAAKARAIGVNIKCSLPPL
jgi:hypothetical protein